MPIGWDETKPADTDGLSGFPAEMRSLKSTLATAFSEHFYFPGSGGGSAASAGQMKPGACRAFYALQSLLSNHTAGFLFAASDTSRLFSLPSSGTTNFVGSARAVEHATTPAASNQRWLYSMGTSASWEATISYGVTYLSIPTVLASIASYALNGSDMTGAIWSLSTVTTTGFQVNGRYPIQGSAIGSEMALHWISLGTI